MTQVKKNAPDVVKKPSTCYVLAEKNPSSDSKKGRVRKGFQETKEAFRPPGKRRISSEKHGIPSRASKGRTTSTSRGREKKGSRRSVWRST